MDNSQSIKSPPKHQVSFAVKTSLFDELHSGANILVEMTLEQGQKCPCE